MSGLLPGWQGGGSEHGQPSEEYFDRWQRQQRLTVRNNAFVVRSIVAWVAVWQCWVFVLWLVHFGGRRGSWDSGWALGSWGKQVAGGAGSPGGVLQEVAVVRLLVENAHIGQERLPVWSFHRSGEQRIHAVVSFAARQWAGVC